MNEIPYEKTLGTTASAADVDYTHVVLETDAVIAFRVAFDRRIIVTSTGIDADDCPTFSVDDMQGEMTELKFHQHPGWDVFSAQASKDLVHVVLLKRKAIYET